MKLSIYLSLLFLSLSTYAFGYQKTLDTLVTCEQQDEADQWVEVGIILNDGPGLRALVVKHNYDNNEATLIFNDRVVGVISDDNESYYYENVMNTFGMTVSGDTGDTGVMSLLLDGPNSINQKKMNCFKNSTISFDSN